MRVLFIGGTSIISSACSDLALQRGIDLYLLNRGRSTRPAPSAAKILQADIRQADTVTSALGDLNFDSVVDWVAYTPDQVQNDLELFRHRTRQYIFISSPSAYQTPPAHLPIQESTPLNNPFWQYSRDKAACEALLQEGVSGRFFLVQFQQNRQWFPIIGFFDIRKPIAGVPDQPARVYKEYSRCEGLE